MLKPGDLKDPWLVAAWPGMGDVAVGAVQHLRGELAPDLVLELDPGNYFDIAAVPVKDALLQEAAWPRNTLYAWKNPSVGGRDLLLFLAEAQPASRGYEFCGRLLEAIAPWNVSRAVTFAAMGTPSHPKGHARVFAVATKPSLIEELDDFGVEYLGDGEISGLNGVFLAAAAKRGIEGMCLLGEFPYFASGIPNPKASAAALRTFELMAGLRLDLAALDVQGEEISTKLTSLLERLQQTGQFPAAPEGIDATGFMFPDDGSDPSDADSGSGTGSGTGSSSDPEAGLAPGIKRRIERLFHEAAKDRRQALRLKSELDRLGVFRDYEDRFLDLFKQGG